MCDFFQSEKEKSHDTLLICMNKARYIFLIIRNGGDRTQGRRKRLDTSPQFFKGLKTIFHYQSPYLLLLHPREFTKKENIKGVTV